MQNAFLLGVVMINQLRLLCILKAWEEGRHGFIPSTHTHPAHFPLYLTRCECHVVLSGTFACVAVSGGEVCLFCVTEKKTAPCVVCCVIWSLALTVTNIRPLLCGWLRAVWWSCMQSVPRDTWPWQHESHSANSLSLVCPTATSPQLLKKKLKQTNPWKQSLVLILGCREGWVSAWVRIGICTGFYCHSILKTHFCHRRIL